MLQFKELSNFHRKVIAKIDALLDATHSCSMPVADLRDDKKLRNLLTIRPKTPVRKLAALILALTGDRYWIELPNSWRSHALTISLFRGKWDTIGTEKAFEIRDYLACAKSDAQKFLRLSLWESRSISSLACDFDQTYLGGWQKELATQLITEVLTSLLSTSEVCELPDTEREDGEKYYRLSNYQEFLDVCKSDILALLSPPDFENCGRSPDIIWYKLYEQNNEIERYSQSLVTHVLRINEPLFASRSSSLAL